MEVRVVMSGSSCGLQDDNVSGVEFYTSAGLENIFHTSVSCSHKWTEQCGVSKEPDAKEIRHSQDYMSISDAGKESARDEVSPSVDINLSTRQAKTALASKGDTPYFSAVATSVLDKAHLFRIATVKHFIYRFVVGRTIKVWAELLKCIPVIIEYLLEGVFIHAFHGCSLRTTITELAK